MSSSVVDSELVLGLEAAPDLFPSLADFRRRALAIHQESGIPLAKDEEWKYTPIRHSFSEPWGPAGSVDVHLEDFAEQIPSGFDEYRVVLVNGIFQQRLSTLGDGDVLIQPLEQAIASGMADNFLGKAAQLEQQDFSVTAHLGVLNKPGIGTFGALNSASFKSGTFIQINKERSIEKPIHVIHISTGSRAADAPRLIISAENGSKATVIETYLSHGETFSTAVTEVFSAENSNLEHVKVQNISRQSIHVGLTEVRQEASSTFRHFNICFGGKLSRNDINVFLGGSQIHTRIDGVVCAAGEQLMDNHTRLDHAYPHCDSFEVYKHLLDDKAEGVFNGKIFVHEDAQKTDAKQTNMALLMSPTATMNTKPQLEIFADDVKCTHGATVGHLREDTVFYMRSRGLSLEQARALQIYAFAAEVLEQIEHEGLRQSVEAQLFKKLGH